MDEPTQVEIPAIVNLPAQASTEAHSIAPDTTAEQDRATADARQVARTTAPTTTEEEDRHALSQREVNKIWEYTQAVIALLVTAAALSVCVILALKGESKDALILVSGAFFLIIGSYFQRTNHTKVGGVQLPYQGR
jgi:hypothetical protein